MEDDGLEKIVEISEHDFFYMFVMQELSKKKREYVSAVKSNVDFLKEIGCDIRFYYSPIKGEVYFLDVNKEQKKDEYKQNPLGFRICGGEQNGNKTNE